MRLMLFWVMSKRVFQLCMVWLLAFSMPLEGFAAAARACCWKADFVTAVATFGATADSHDDCHEGEVISVVAQATPAHEKAPSHAAAHGRCKACAHCTFGATGVPSFLHAIVVDFIAPRPSLTVPASFLSHISPGLDRPPKLFDLLS